MDRKNNISLSEGRAPALPEIKEAVTRIRPDIYDIEDLPDSEDELLAWTLTARARQIAFLQGWEVCNLSFESWVILPCDSGALSQWFEGQNAAYRLFVHRSPVSYKGRLIGHPWETAYSFIKPRIYHRRKLASGLKLHTTPFVDAIREAYSRSRKAAEEIIHKTGHPYAFSRGLL